jgi:AcrR family transcriptional regulator
VRKVDPVKHEAKRRQVLEAAVRCFVRYGFHGASIAHLCAEAEMSAGHLYHYFRSKDAIVDAIIDANLQRASDRFGNAVKAGASILDIVADQVRDAALHGSNSTPLLFDMLAEAGRSPATAKALREHSYRMHTILTNLLHLGQERGEIDPSLDPEAVAPVLVSLVDGAKSLALRNPDRSSGRDGDVMRMLISRFLSTPVAG